MTPTEWLEFALAQQRDEILTLQREIEVLRQVLNTHGRHFAECGTLGAHRDPRTGCTCGFEVARPGRHR